MSELAAPFNDHTHAGPPSRSEYVKGCRHPDCSLANARYKTERERLRNRPDEAWAAKVPAGAARRHLAELTGAGVSLEQVSRLSGVPARTLRHILGAVLGTDGAGELSRRRERRNISPTTARRILDVGLRGATADLVDATPTKALLDDLAAEGYSASRVAAMLGLERLVVDARVTTRFGESVAALHERLLGTDPIEGIDMAGVEPELWWPPPVGEWAARARCQPRRDRADMTDLFFPGRGDDAGPARAICGGCQVRHECLAYALAHRDIQGIWGATNTEERHRMRGAR